jgi:cytochrome P450
MDIAMGIISLIVGGFFYATCVFVTRKRRLGDFSGPFALPIIGNLYDPSTVSILTYIKKMSKIYGKIFVFWAGSSPMLVVTEPKLARTILADTVTFIKGPDYTEKFGLVFGDGLVTSTGKKHKEDRACLGKYFIHSKITDHIPSFMTETHRTMNEYIEPFLGQDVNLESFFHILALRIFGKFSISKDYGSPENRGIADIINESVKFGSNIVGRHIILNLPMSRIFPGVRKLIQKVNYIDSHLDDIIDDRIILIEKAEDPPDDILDALLANAIPREKIRHHLRTLLSAGHDTTAFFGCYMAYLLSHHPDVQYKIKKEIREVLEDGNISLTSDRMKQLIYCRMVIQETLRLYTIIPFVNRVATRDYKREDTYQVLKHEKIIPKGTVLLIGLSTMNRDGELWDTPYEFIPERFRDIQGHCSAKHGYMPFGYGSRTCIGNNLAMVEGVVILVSLMTKYNLFPVSSFKPDIIAGISLISRNGVIVRVERDNKTH